MNKPSFCISLFVLLLLHTRAHSQSPSITYSTAHTVFRLAGELNGFTAHFSSAKEADGLEYVTLTLQAAAKQAPQPLSIKWSYPMLNVAGVWTPGRSLNKNINAGGGTGLLKSRATTNAPVTLLYGYDNSNRLSFACSDALNSIGLSARVNESTAMADCEVQLFTEPQPAIDHYTLTIRLDTRSVPYWEALRAVAGWWAAMPLYRPATVPDKARWPMYSTWYSFHQQLDPGAIEKQCRLAKELGCETVLVDDGWQTTSNTPGYAYTGDWEPLRIPQMKAMTESIHALGMKCMLWYSVPFVGENAKAYTLFKGKYLYYRKRWKAYALDPRFPEVREYLINKYRQAVQQWDMDGLKLDFVDLFVPDENGEQPETGGRDYASINEAVDRLLTDVIQALKAIKPDVMIEFRQSYTGPLMRKYGNMFRAGDTPDDALTNRVSTTDIRLLCGQTAAHADMLMWNTKEKAELAALQLLNVLFAVPQVSVKLDEIPADHRRMLRFWLQYWRENRALLLDASFQPGNPALNYPQITVADANKQITAVYSEQVVVKLNAGTAMLDIVNATASANIVVDVAKDAAVKSVCIFDCTGQLLTESKIPPHNGLLKLEVPPAGLVRIR